MDLKSMIRNVKDFPVEGICFKDITTLLKDGKAFRHAIKQMAEAVKEKEVELVAGPEARGFLIGAPLAFELGVGFIPARKSGKLPAETISSEYELEYGKDVLEMHKDAIKKGQKVLVVDDLLATGGTIYSTIEMVEKLGGVVVGVAFLIELTFLSGRENLKNYDVFSIIKY